MQQVNKPSSEPKMITTKSGEVRPEDFYDRLFPRLGWLVSATCRGIISACKAIGRMWAGAPREDIPGKKIEKLNAQLAAIDVDEGSNTAGGSAAAFEVQGIRQGERGAWRVYAPTEVDAKSRAGEQGIIEIKSVALLPDAPRPVLPIVSGVCSNCERTMGKLETAHSWQGHVVCPQCFGILQASAIHRGEKRPFLPTTVGGAVVVIILVLLLFGGIHC